MPQRTIAPPPFFLPRVRYQTPVVTPDTNYTLLDTTNLKPRDAFEAYLLSNIDSYQQQVQKPGLDPALQRVDVGILRSLQNQWEDHQVMLQSREQFARQGTNSIAALNMPDPISQSLMVDAAHYQREANDPSLSSNMRAYFARVSQDYQQKLADHQTNARLWADVISATQSKDEERITETRQALADYLTARLSKINGKHYPEHMSLDAISAEYRNESGTGHWFENPIYVRAIIIALFALPAMFLAWAAFARRMRR